MWIWNGHWVEKQNEFKFLKKDYSPLAIRSLQVDALKSSQINCSNSKHLSRNKRSQYVHCDGVIATSSITKANMTNNLPNEVHQEEHQAIDFFSSSSRCNSASLWAHSLSLATAAIFRSILLMFFFLLASCIWAFLFFFSACTSSKPSMH